MGQQRSELTSYMAYIKWKMPQNQSLNELSHMILGSYPTYLGLSRDLHHEPGAGEWAGAGPGEGAGLRRITHI